MNNYFRTFLLIAAMTGLFLAVGYLIGGQSGMLIAFGIAAAMNLFAYWNADKMVLRMYGARAGRPQPARREFYGIVERAGAARRPADAAASTSSRTTQPNAFATGRNPQNAAVAATTGLLQLLSREEIAGVMAHELAHVKNRDTLTMTITATLAGAIVDAGEFRHVLRRQPRPTATQPARHRSARSLMMILAPIAAMLVQMAISRTREYEADRVGAEISGQPLWLASALAKISHGAAQIDPTRRPSATRRRRICSSSTRCRAAARTACSRPIPAWRTALRRLRAMAATAATVAPRRGPAGAKAASTS